MKTFKTSFITKAAIIAALYIVLTLLLQPISIGMIQFRLSEALTVLPFFTPCAIPGITVGCLFANLLAGANVLDVIFGSLASALGALGSYFLRKHRYLVPLPPVIANTLIIPLVLKLAYGDAQPFILLVASIGISEVVSCYILGLAFIFLLEKYKIKIK